MTDEGVAILCALYSHLYEPSESEGDELAEFFSKEEEDEASGLADLVEPKDS